MALGTSSGRARLDRCGGFRLKRRRSDLSIKKLDGQSEVCVNLLLTGQSVRGNGDHMRHDDIITSLVDILQDEGSDAAAHAIADAGGHLEAEVALLDGELTVAEALDYAENLFALNAFDAGTSVVEEAVRGAWGLPLYAAA
jgi:hypothetical protein